MKTYSKHYLIIFFAMILFVSCKKDAEFALSPIKAINSFDLKGYTIKDTLEQYFDGIKLRDFYGKISLGTAKPKLAFENDFTVMQFKNKRTGEVIYEQKFNINDVTNVVPNFYFDGTKLTNSYAYPKPVGKEFLVNFYVDVPKETQTVDIAVDVLEYLTVNNKMEFVKITSFPIATNMAVSNWSDYFTLVPAPTLVPTQTGTRFLNVVTIKDGKTKKYIINDDVRQSSFQVTLPTTRTTVGRTQSIHIIEKRNSNRDLILEANNLVQLFP